MTSHPFDEILGLEEQFYNDGVTQGQADGVKVGRIEGRTFGLEKGFEKYVESGKLYGKSLVWANRIQQFRSQEFSSERAWNGRQDSTDAQRHYHLTLPLLPNNQRLQKNVKALHALAESESLSTENTEEAVSDFDDRLKRAQVKAKIVERMVGEATGDIDGNIKAVRSNDGSIEDVSVLKARH